MTFLLDIEGNSYAFSTIICEEKDPGIQNLTDVNEKSETFNKCELLSYPFTRVLKLNTNALTTIDEVKHLNNLLELQAKTNQIADINFMAEHPDFLKYLQKADLNQNKITQLPNIKCESLFQLVLDENEIASADLFGHKALRFLHLNKNKLTDCKGI